MSTHGESRLHVLRAIDRSVVKANSVLVRIGQLRFRG